MKREDAKEVFIMTRSMKIIAGSFCFLTLLFLVFYCRFQNSVMLTCAIASGTTAYHFCIRLLIGWGYQQVLKNKVDYTKKWFQTTKKEEKLYEKLKVKKWKNKMPTFDSSAFDMRYHTLDEIAQAMCQSELVHETIVIFSFVPILASIWVGALPVFIITSVFAAFFDSLFVMMQRFNRPRMIRLMEKKTGQDI